MQGFFSRSPRVPARLEKPSFTARLRHGKAVTKPARTGGGEPNPIRSQSSFGSAPARRHSCAATGISRSIGSRPERSKDPILAVAFKAVSRRLRGVRPARCGPVVSRCTGSAQSRTAPAREVRHSSLAARRRRIPGVRSACPHGGRTTLRQGCESCALPPSG